MAVIFEGAALGRHVRGRTAAWSTLGRHVRGSRRGVVNTRESVAVFACGLSAFGWGGSRHE